MILHFFAFLCIVSICSIAQTNILHLFSFTGIFPIPDLSFIVLVYIAFTQGKMSGQILGFCSGLILDFMSLAPFGFNAFVRTLSGYLIGRFKGVILLDNLFLPMAVISLALIVKTLISIITGFLIGQTFIIQRILSTEFVFEFLLTIILTPLVFWPLRGISSFILSRKAYR